jgi:hypothetical protein
MTMRLWENACVQKALVDSGISQSGWDKVAVRLEALVATGRVSADSIVAIADDGWGTIFVSKEGIAKVGTAGMVKRHPSVDQFVPLSEITSVLAQDGGYKDRREHALVVKGAGNRELLKLTWEGWIRDGAISADVAHNEQDRILDALKQAASA